MTTPKQLTAELERRLDGPHADEHTAAAAHLAAEAIRYLNYATGSHSPEGLTWPSTVYEIIADLSVAAGRMPQLLAQMAEWLTAEDNAGHLAMDDHSPARAAVTLARIQMGYAADQARTLAVSLGRIQENISGLNGRGPDREAGA
jgi:hypothetical protein